MKKIKKLFKWLLKHGYYPYNFYHLQDTKYPGSGWHTPNDSDFKEIKKWLTNTDKL